MLHPPKVKGMEDGPSHSPPPPLTFMFFLLTATFHVEIKLSFVFYTSSGLIYWNGSLVGPVYLLGLNKPGGSFSCNKFLTGYCCSRVQSDYYSS
ncbi:hypothetical protein HanRHA438_Chr13g0620891 [Helianthus annuus]|nr:hypothetical protein HanRHA438_Chr13g0620891 [Helianthus annuus]